MKDEILKQKIRFAKEALMALRISMAVLIVVVVVGACYAIYHGRLLAAFMGWFAGVAGSLFLLFHFLHIQSWLEMNERRVDQPRVDQ